MSIERQAEQRSTPRKAITFTRFDQIEAKPLRAVIDGLLYADTLAGITGRSGSCKSFLAQGFAASIATGTDWVGHAVAAGAVFYLAGEGLAGIKKRFRGWEQHTGISLDGAALYVSGGIPSLADESIVAEVLAEIEATVEAMHDGSVVPVLIVVDTLARALAGRDENSAADMGRLIAGLDWMRQRWGCCVAVIHHTGHGDSSQARARGSSAYYAALDAELLVTSDGKRVTVASTKEKDWPKHPDMLLDRHLVHVQIGQKLESTLVLDRIDPAQSQDQIRAEILRLRAEGLSIRKIMDATGGTKWKVESTLANSRKAAPYAEASDGR